MFKQFAPQFFKKNVTITTRPFANNLIARAKPVKRFYNDHTLAKYDKKNVLYMADIGIIENEQMYKFGKTSKLYERDFKQHRKTFDKFDLIDVMITDNKDVVEDMFKRELEVRNLLKRIKIKNRYQTELFITSDEYSIQYIIQLFHKVIEDNPSYEVKELQKQLDFYKKELEYYRFKEDKIKQIISTSIIEGGQLTKPLL